MANRLRTPTHAFFFFFFFFFYFYKTYGGMQRISSILAFFFPVSTRFLPLSVYLFFHIKGFCLPPSNNFSLILKDVDSGHSVIDGWWRTDT